MSSVEGDAPDLEHCWCDLYEAMRKRGPLCPDDLPGYAWDAVAANYDAESWEPGLAYYPEYRDARAAVHAVVSKVTDILRQLDLEHCQADESGERDTAWYRHRADLESALGLQRDALACELELFETAGERDG